MKLLCITNLFPNHAEPNRATFNRQQFKAFSRYAEIKVIAPVSYFDYLKFTKKANIIQYKESIDGIEVFHPIYYYTPKFLRIFYGFYYLFSIFYTCSKINRIYKPDCIFATWAYPDGFASILLGKLFNCPVFIKIHGSDIHSISGRIVYKLTAWALIQSKKVFSVSNDLRNKIIKMGVPAKKVIVAYNGINHELFFPIAKNTAKKRLNLESDKKQIVYIGNLKKIKNVDLLIHAFVMANIRKTQLCIIGEGPMETILKGLIEKIERDDEKNCENSILLVGNRSHLEIPFWINSADMIILPSSDEGVPNVVLEAMACGVPVVASNVGGIAEVVHEDLTGILVKPDDIKELKTSIRISFQKKWNKDIIHEKSRDFTWEENAQKIYSAIIKYLQ